MVPARRLRARSRGATGYYQAVAVRQRIRFAIAFLDALGDRGLTLATAAQPDLEAWLTSDAATGRHELGDFIRWAGANRLTGLTMPSSNWAGPADAIQAQDRWDQARRLLHDQTLSPADRVAGLLVLLYAQRAAGIARLTAHPERPRRHPGRRPPALGAPNRSPCLARWTASSPPSPAPDAGTARSVTAEPRRGCSLAADPGNRSAPTTSASG